MRIFVSYLIGLLFGLGIVVSGMVNPAKVINFFDVFGTWDPSLAFVMGGALITTLIGYRIVLKRSDPLFEPRFKLPVSSRVDARLLAGAAVFGVGWGIAGFCPGGAVPAIGTGRSEVFVFFAGLLPGLIATRFLLARWDDRRAQASAADLSDAPRLK
ncbi:MAG: YeeE/YedE family protein [Alphaproteobacteria bacterium]|nr:YeeE/YedE family protein [Alphaproteobacteria bacterium]